MLAGLLSFLSPCVVPLLPGYLSYATGMSAATLDSGNRGRMFLGSPLFVAGLSILFVSYGALFGQLGNWLSRYQRPIVFSLGIATIVMGIAFMGLIPFLQRDVRVRSLPRVGLLAAPLMGLMFGLGRTPCGGPTLGSVLSLSMNEASAGRGAILSAAYCLGLGTPFVVAGLALVEPCASLAGCAGDKH
jgi:cytochrome c-type biogenesis protein